MLNSPTPFPQVGSYGLKNEGSETVLARIIAKDDDGNVTISMPHRTGASGTATVPLGDLIDGTPLTDAEREEYEDLGRRDAAAARRDPKRQARIAQLRLRDIYSTILDAQLATLSRDRRAAA